MRFSIRSLLWANAFIAVSLAVSRVSETSVVAGICTVMSLPAFLFGPFLLIWGKVRWRPTADHNRKWFVTAVSFAMLSTPLVAGFTIYWWFVNLPGYLVFWIVANSEKHNPALAVLSARRRVSD